MVKKTKRKTNKINNEIKIGNNIYIIQKRIGELSSNALIFKVKNKKDNKTYVLKITYNNSNPEKLKTYEELRDSGIYEYYILSKLEKLNVTNIPKVYDYSFLKINDKIVNFFKSNIDFQEKYKLYISFNKIFSKEYLEMIIMEHITGYTYYKKCFNRKNKKCSVYKNQICGIMDNIHNLGITHNDLHYNNIIISKDKPIIIDWARAIVHNDKVSWYEDSNEQRKNRWNKKPNKCY